MIVVLGVTGWFLYQAPFKAFESLKIAAEENNTQQFNALIDADAIRKALTQDFKGTVTLSTSDPLLLDNAYAKAAQALSGTLIASVVNPILTPAGMHQLLTQGIVNRRLLGLPEKTKPAPQPDDLRADNTAQIVPPTEMIKKAAPSPLTEEAGYESFNYFKVRLQSDGEVKPVILTFERNHLISWRLVRIGFGL